MKAGGFTVREISVQISEAVPETRILDLVQVLGRLDRLVGEWGGEAEKEREHVE